MCRIPEVLERRTLLTADVRFTELPAGIADGELVAAYEQWLADPSAQPANNLTVDADGRPWVEMSVRDVPAAVGVLEAAGANVTSTVDSGSYRLVAAYVPFGQLGRLLADGGVLTARVGLRPDISVDATSSEWATQDQGGISVVFDQLSTTRRFGDYQPGQYVKVGIISNSFNQQTAATPTVAQQQAAGDLPPNERLFILDDVNVPSRSDEGRAMMELMYDIIPNATFYFHTVGLGMTDMAAAISELAAAGVDIIVDDIGSIVHPFFQDGPVVEAVNRAYAEFGTLHFSAAGNGNGNTLLVPWQDEDNDGYLEFADGSEQIVVTATMDSAGNSDIDAKVYWSQPWGASSSEVQIEITQVGSLNPSQVTVSGNVGSNPFERLNFAATPGTQYLIQIKRTGGDDLAGESIYVDMGKSDSTINSPMPDVLTPSSAGNKHSPLTFTVGAHFNGVNNIRSSSARGTVQHLFTAKGTRTNSLEPLQFPTVVARTGVTTTTTGFTTFFGTSAAAPNAAAVAALVLGLERARRAPSVDDPTETDISFDEMLTILARSGKGQTSSARDPVFGYGSVNFAGAYFVSELVLEDGVATPSEPNVALNQFGDVVLESVRTIRFRPEASGLATIRIEGVATNFDPFAVLAPASETSRIDVASAFVIEYENGSSEDVTLTSNVVAGHEYVLLVRQEQPADVGPSSFKVTIDAPEATFGPEFVDDNGNGLTSARGDQFFELTAPASASGELYVTGIPYGTNDLTLQLFDHSGTLLLEEDRTAGGITETLNFYDVVPGETYALLVSTTNTGLYNVVVDFAQFSEIHGTVRTDFDGDGNADVGDTGLAGQTVYIDRNDNQTFDTFTERFFSRTVSQPLTESAPLSSTLFVDGTAGTVRDVNVTLNIEHDHFSDVTVVLVSPQGTRVRLFGGVGTDAEMQELTFTLDDEAAADISGHTPPVTGSFRSDEPLGAFDGENPTGVWTLEVTDLLDGGIGSLRAWSIELLADEPSVVTDANGEYEFTQLRRGAYSIGVEGPTGSTVTRATYFVSAEISVGAGDPFVGPEPEDVANSALSDDVEALIDSREFVGLPPVDTPLFGDLDGRGYTIAIIDNELDTDHPHFGPDSDNDGIADRIIATFDFADGDSNVNDFTVLPHGTEVSAVAASSSPDYPGMAPGANIVFFKIRPSTVNGVSPLQAISQSLAWIADNAEQFNIAAVNMSFGSVDGAMATPKDWGSYSDEIERVADAGVILVASAGNVFVGGFGNTYGSQPGTNYPAVHPQVISVGASYDAGRTPYVHSTAGADTQANPDQIVVFSNRHERTTDIFAPGFGYTTATRGGGTRSFGGTSGAAPHVAGIVVLAQQLADRVLGRRLSLVEMRELLRESGVKIHDGDDELSNAIDTGGTYYRVDAGTLFERIINLAQPQMAHAVLSPDFSASSVDFLISTPVLIDGVVFYDFDASGSQDGGEPGLLGELVFVDLNGNHRRDQAYAIESFAAGAALDIPAGDTGSVDVSLTIDVRNVIGTVSGFDGHYGAVHPTPSLLQVVVESPAGTLADWDNSFDAFSGENPNGVWTLHVTNPFGAGDGVLTSWSFDLLIDEPWTLTGSDGSYSFALPPGGLEHSFIVRQQLSAGWLINSPVGSSHPLGTTVSGEVYSGLNFANVQAGSLSGEKYLDVNGNGRRDMSEPPVAGQTIYLDLNRDGDRDTSTFELTGFGTPNNIDDGATYVAAVGIGGMDRLTLLDLDVEIHVTHQTLADLDIFLISPSGARIELATDVGGTSDDYSGTIFDDEAADALEDGSAPYSGRFRPEGDLSVLEGLPANGEWVLELTDDRVNGIGGRLLDWSLHFTVGEPATTTDSDGHFSFSNLLPAVYPVAEVVPAGWRQTEPGLPHFIADIGSGEQQSNVVFGNYQIPKITGLVFEDANGNGRRDSGEPPVSGAVVFADLDGNELPGQATQTFAASNLPQDIVPAEGRNEFLSAVTVAGFAGSIADVQVTLDIDSLLDSDRLTAILRSPSGTEVTLISGVGTGGGGFGVVTFDESASSSITTAAEPISGSLRPLESFSAFAGEAAAGTWTLLLSDSSGELDPGVLTTWSLQLTVDEPASTTAGNGLWSLDLPPGSFSIQQIVPAGFIQIAPAANAAHGVNLVSGTSLTTLNFADVRPVTIEGRLYEDGNANGSFDDGEVLLTDIYAAFLDLDRDGTLDDGEPSAFSDGDGIYRIENVPPGAYDLRFDLAGIEDWIVTEPVQGFYRVLPRSGDAPLTGLDFGALKPATVRGTVWLDEDVNGVLDGGEIVLPNRRVYVDANDNRQLDEGELFDKTNGAGEFEIFGLLPGTHEIRQDLDDGWMLTSPSQLFWFEQQHPSGGHVVTVAANSITEGLNFGNARPVTLSGLKFNDVNGDGFRAEPPEDEPGVGGFTFFIDANGDFFHNRQTSTFATEGERIVIPDEGSAESTISVTGLTDRILDLKVTIDIEHLSIPDLRVFLQSPTGTIITLVTGLDATTWDNRRDFSGTRFDDNAPLGLTDGAAPFAATFRPWEPLSTFAGELPNGDWKLIVDDKLPLFDGRIINWSLELETGEALVVSGDDGTFEFAPQAPGTFTVNELPREGWIQTALISDSGVRTLASGETADDLIAGNQELVITGLKYNDLNANGVRDAGEPGLAGWRIFVDSIPNQQFDSELVSVTTSDPELAIPNNGSITSRLEFSATPTNPSLAEPRIAELTVHVDINHLNVEDLTMELVGPTGTRITLVKEAGGQGDHFVATSFRDDAVVPVSAAAAPFSGTFRPQQSLAAFAGQIATGEWTLVVTDDSKLTQNGVPLHAGTLLNWSIDFVIGEPSDVTDSNGQFRLPLMFGLGNEVREEQQPGWLQTSPEFGSYFVYGFGDNAGLEFGNVQHGIFGAKYEDENGNGIRELSEPGLADWPVFIDLNGNATLDETLSTVESSAAVPVPDGQFTFAMLDVSGLDGVLNDLEVTLDLAHTQIGEVELTLISPAGTRVRLARQNGADGDHMTVTTFDDQATTSIFDGLPPFSGAFRPQQPLSAFTGEDPNGTWTLEIVDSFSEVGGNLQSWSLDITHGEPRVLTDANGRFVFAGVPDGTYSIREVNQAGWVQTEPSQLQDGAHVVEIGPDSPFVDGVLFGNYAEITLSGTRWLDLDADGIRETGEPGIEGSIIYLDLDGDGLFDNMVDQFTTTNEDGEFTLGGVAPGKYALRAAFEPGFDQTFPELPSHVVFASSGDQLDGLDFGFAVRPVTIRGTVYNDLDNSDTLTAGDEGIGGQFVFVDINEDGVADDTTTFTDPLPFSTPLADNATGLNPAVSTRSIDVAGVPGLLDDVNVFVNIAHADVSELTLTLIAPTGQRVELANQPQTISTVGFAGTTFDDEAAIDLLVFAAPWPIPVRPTGALADLAGIDPNGTWTLEVVDSRNGNAGTLNEFRLNLSTSDPATTTDENGEYSLIVPYLSDGLFSNFVVRTQVDDVWAPTAPADATQVFSVIRGGTRNGVDFGNEPTIPETPVVLVSGGVVMVLDTVYVNNVASSTVTVQTPVSGTAQLFVSTNTVYVLTDDDNDGVIALTEGTFAVRSANVIQLTVEDEQGDVIVLDVDINDERFNHALMVEPGSTVHVDAGLVYISSDDDSDGVVLFSGGVVYTTTTRLVVQTLSPQGGLSLPSIPIIALVDEDIPQIVDVSLTPDTGQPDDRTTSSPLATVAIQFSENIFGDLDGIVVRNSQNSIVDLSVEQTAPDVLTVTFEKALFDNTYELTVAGLKDIASNFIIPETFSFTIDQTSPTAALTEPVDNSPSDLDPASGAITLLQPPAAFVLALDDGSGSGIDLATVKAESVRLLLEGSPLTDGDEYEFSFDSGSNLLRLESTAANFKPGPYEIVFEQSPGSAIRDVGGNVIAPASLTLTIPTVDLSVSQTVTQNPPIAGETTFYHFDVTNQSDTEATGVLLSWPLPPGAAFLPVVPLTPVVSVSGDTVTVDFATLAAHSTESVDVFVSFAPDTTGPVSSVVSVTSDQIELTPLNNSNSLMTGIDHRATVNPVSVQTVQSTPVDVELTGSDIDGDTVKIGLLDQPLHGQLQPTSAASGLSTYRYIPDAGFSGTESVRFYALSIVGAEARLSSNIGLLTIQVDAAGVIDDPNNPGSRILRTFAPDGDNQIGLSVDEDAGTITVTVGGQTQTFDFADLDGLEINGGSGDDELVIDLDVLAAAGINRVTYNGGSGFDTLLLTGGEFGTSQVDLTNGSDGIIYLDGTKIAFLGLEPVDMTGTTATDVVLNLPNGSVRAVLEPFATGQLRLRSLDTPQSFEETIFNIPSGMLTINGGGGDDFVDASTAGVAVVLNGGDGNDTLIGGDFDDVISGDGSNDQIDGNAGNDTLNGGSGDDVISGGADNDFVWADAGEDVVSGGSGHDRLFGNAGDDSINGDDGDDELYGGSQKDTLSGGDGNDYVDGQGGAGDRISGGNGTDTLNGGAGGDFLIESAARLNSQLTAGLRIELRPDSLTFTSQSGTMLEADVLIDLERANLTGTSFDDLITTEFAVPGFTEATLLGALGNDTLTGSNVAELILGGGGHDQLFGAGGFDRLLGASGNDTLDGGDGDDVLRGQQGADSLVGGAGNDKLDGGTENDTLRGGDGNDTLTGGDGDDGLSGGADNDSVIAGAGNDLVFGGAGADTLRGGSGNDTLFGNADADQLFGDNDADTLDGNSGGESRDEGDTFSDPSEIDEAFILDPLPAWADIL